MYNSPIEMLITDIQNQIVKQQDEEIFQAVLHYIPNVDKAELLRALQYDRNQYDKGYADGKADALSELVRCKDCNHFNKQGYDEDNAHEDDLTLHMGFCLMLRRETQACRFCSYGERKDND